MKKHRLQCDLFDACLEQQPHDLQGSGEDLCYSCGSTCQCWHIEQAEWHFREKWGNGLQAKTLRLAQLPRPSGEQHEMDPPHHLCMGDDPCICIHLAACQELLLRDVISAIEAEQQNHTDSHDTPIRLGLGIAKSVVTKLMREEQ